MPCNVMHENVNVNVQISTCPAAARSRPLAGEAELFLSRPHHPCRRKRNLFRMRPADVCLGPYP